MGSYTDDKGRQWLISVNYGMVLYLKDSCNIDLLEPYANEESATLGRIIQNRYALINTVFQVVKYSNKGAKDEEIWNSFNGDGLVNAQEAFFNDWANFSRQGGRPDMAAAIELTQEVIRAGVREVEARIKTFDVNATITRLSQNAQAEMEKTLTKLSGD